MNEKELLFHFPYSIDKQYFFRHFINDVDGFTKRYLPGYTTGNVLEYIYEKSKLNEIEKSNIHYLYHTK
jgi:hypothetical protein